MLETKTLELSPHYAARFWSKVRVPDPATGCMLWMGSYKPNGYGQFSVKADGTFTKRYPHRIAYTLANGPIPPGLVIDHLCRNRACVNPVHLEPVTQAVNQHRGTAAEVTRARHFTMRGGRTHCVNGHALTPTNTRTRKRKGCVDSVRCMTCQRVAQAKYDTKR